MADIVQINPRFQLSHGVLEPALPFLGKRANFPPACLPLFAALTPAGHRIQDAVLVVWCGMIVGFDNGANS